MAERVAIEEAQELKKQLEAEIAKKLEWFYIVTGLKVQSLECPRLESSRIGEGPAYHVTAEVSL
jgi:hypothetical protein